MKGTVKLQENAKNIDIVQFYKKNTNQCTAAILQEIKLLRDGKYMENVWSYLREPALFIVEVEPESNPLQDYWDQQEAFGKLLEKAVKEKDYEAAMQYCQHEFAGEISHAAMG